MCVQVLEDSRAVLIAANMQPDDLFPLDDKIKEGERDWLYHRSERVCVRVCALSTIEAQYCHMLNHNYNILR